MIEPLTSDAEADDPIMEPRTMSEREYAVMEQLRRSPVPVVEAGPMPRASAFYNMAYRQSYLQPAKDSTSQIRSGSPIKLIVYDDTGNPSGVVYREEAR